MKAALIRLGIRGFNPKLKKAAGRLQGGHPKQIMVLKPVSRLGPPPRSFAADAYDCIMVRSATDLPNTRLWIDDPRPMAKLPL